jgi:hypothetical protein
MDDGDDVDHQARIDELHAAVAEGLEAEKTVLRYCDWLITAVNPREDGGAAGAAASHPCSVPLTAEMQSDSQTMDNDYEDLLNKVSVPCSALLTAPFETQFTLNVFTKLQPSPLLSQVQRHNCVSTYCMRIPRNAGPDAAPVCRFGYPQKTENSSTLAFEELANGSVRVTIALCRNDGRLNPHARLQLHHWRANVDIQIILDGAMALRYMVRLSAGFLTA